MLVEAPPSLILSLHSFTPALATCEKPRPWHVGVLYNQDDRAARVAIPMLEAEGLCVGDQQPYSGVLLNATMNRHAKVGCPIWGWNCGRIWWADAARLGGAAGKGGGRGCEGASRGIGQGKPRSTQDITMPAYRSRTSTHGRNMAGARGLWRATGMKDGDFGKPIIAIVNSFTQFVPGHVHLKDLGQLVARQIEAAGGVAKEFNTIAVDDGIAMGHDGMLYSLPSRDLIADSVEYMVNAHCADAMVCISNCDKITPGMLMAALRINIPVVFVSGGPMEAGKVVLKGKTVALDLVDAMVAAADERYSDEEVDEIERDACPTCGSAAACSPPIR